MLYLASLLDQPVRGKANETIGRLEDLIVRVGEDLYPPVTGLVIRDGRRNFFVPATQLESLNGVTRLASSTVSLRPFLRRDGEILLRKDVLDHQIIDISGRRIVRVNDVQMACVENIYRIAGVDVSAQALLRRLAPHSLSHRFVGRRIIDWQAAQYLASEAPVQLKVSYDRLSELNPVDLARIVDALSYRESAEIVAALDDETAADVMEEVSEKRLSDLLEGMDKERAADILEEMSPAAAADALEDLEEDAAEQIIANMEPEEAAEIQELLGHAEGSAGRIMRTDFVRVRASATVGDTLALLRALPEVPDPLSAVYVVTQHSTAHESSLHASNDNRTVILRGIVELRSLVIADSSTHLTEVMNQDTPTVNVKDRAEEVARIMAEYNLLAVPVLDDCGCLSGIVTVDDALAELLPKIWQNRVVRAFA